MKLLGLDGRQQSWGPAAQFNPRRPPQTRRALCWTLSLPQAEVETVARGHSWAELRPYRCIAKAFLAWHSGGLGAGGTDAILGLIGLSYISSFLQAYVTPRLNQRLFTRGSDIPWKMDSCTFFFFLHKWNFLRSQQFPVQQCDGHLCI